MHAKTFLSDLGKFKFQVTKSLFVFNPGTVAPNSFLIFAKLSPQFPCGYKKWCNDINDTTTAEKAVFSKANSNMLHNLL